MRLRLARPIPVNPKQAARINILNVHVDFKYNKMAIDFEYLAEDGTVLERAVVHTEGETIEDWIKKQGALVKQRLLMKLGAQEISE